MARLLFLAAALLTAGCGDEDDPGWEPPHGDRFVTPEYGLTFYWTGPYNYYRTPEDVAQGIDDAFYEWLTLFELRFGYAYSRYELWQVVRYVNIQLYNSYQVPGGYYGTWWASHSQIDTALGTPYHYDSYIDTYTQGVQQLKHEWTHVVRGDSH